MLLLLLFVRWRADVMGMVLLDGREGNGSATVSRCGKVTRRRAQFVCERVKTEMKGSCCFNVRTEGSGICNIDGTVL